MHTGEMISTDDGRTVICIPVRIVGPWSSENLRTGTGYVKADPADVRGGMSQRSSSGTAYLADGARSAVLVWDYPLLDEHLALGGPEGELGFPSRPDAARQPVRWSAST